MTRKPLSILIAGLFAAAPAVAQDLGAQWASQGSVSLGGIYVDLDSRDAARAEQYRDLNDGVLFNFDVRARSAGGFWLDAVGDNVGRRDNYLSLRGGVYDQYKFRVYSDWLQQARVFDARTPFTGHGTGDLRARFPLPNANAWERVDIGYDRKDTGGYFEWQRNSPWYFRVDANEVRTEGTKIGASSNGTSPGNGFVDLAIPVDYRTTNASFEGGYSTSRYQFSASYTLSEFKSGQETVTWSNPFWGSATDTTFLAPDNDYQRLALQGSVRQLPYNTTISARATWDRLESNVNLATSALNGVNVFGATNPDVGTFNGEVENTTFTLALASAPLKGFDVRGWYNYAKRDDTSTLVEYRPVSGLACGTTSTGAPGPCDNEHYDYTKWNVGVDAYWKFMKGNRFGAGIEYQNIEQERPDYDEIENTKIFVEYRNTMVDGLSARIKYTYLDRDSNFLLSHHGLNANDVLYLERFIGRYDGQGVERHELKLAADWAPMAMMDVGLEFNWRENKWKRSGLPINFSATSLPPFDEFLGRTNDKRWQVSGTLSYGDPSKFRTTLFADFEKIRHDSYHRNIGAGSCPTTSGGVTANNCFDPGTTQNSIAYNWSARNEDENWMYGIGVDWPVMAKLLVKASYLYVKTDGSADIVSQNNFGNPLPIVAYDDSKTHSFNIKGIYTIDKNWSVTAGYAYEKYTYSDDQFNGYQYTVPFPGVTNNTSQSYFNGFGAFTNYRANIVYLTGTYRF